jgi:hypothetical protein
MTSQLSFKVDRFSKDLYANETWFQKWLDKVSDFNGFTCNIDLGELANARHPFGATADFIANYSNFCFER